MTHDVIDRRKYDRSEIKPGIFIEVVARGCRSEAHNTIVRCETLNISVGGLRMRVPEPIKAGSRLNLAVPMDDWKENLELAGEAIWCRAAQDGEGFWIGLELEDASHEDMEKWCKVVHTHSA